MSTHRLLSAINAAEVVAKPTSPASTPVTVMQETLCALIEDAKMTDQLQEKVNDMRDDVDTLRKIKKLL